MSDGDGLARWWVYVLRCGDGTCYTGITTDVQRRLAEHAAGKGARYTRGRLPVGLLGTVPCASRSEAACLEARLRRLPPEVKVGLVRRDDAEIETVVATQSSSDAAPSGLKASSRVAG